MGTHGIAEAVAQHRFLLQRLNEYAMFREIALGRLWTPGALIAASDWLQRKIADSLETPEALTVLAELGRTRRVRNTAKTKINRGHN